MNVEVDDFAYRLKDKTSTPKTFSMIWDSQEV